MPNPYTIIITFDAEDINNTPDTMQLILTFTVSENASNETHTNSAKNLEVKSYGKMSLQFNIDDPLLVPSSVDMQIADPDSYLDGLLFDSTQTAFLTDKQFEVELKLNGTTEFLGHAVKEQIFFDVGTKVLRFKAKPKSNILTEKLAFNNDGAIRDPFTYSNTSTFAVSNASHSAGTVTVIHASNSGFNVGLTAHITGITGMTELNDYWLITQENSDTSFDIALTTDQSFSAGGTCQVMQATGAYKDFSDMLDDIFQLIDASISFAGGGLDIRHDWVFNADKDLVSKGITNATHSGGVVTVTHSSATPHYTTGDDVIIENVVGMTDLNARFDSITVNSNSEFTVSLTTAQNYTYGGSVKELIDVLLQDSAILSSVVFLGSGRSDIRSVADVLKKFAFDFGAFTGLIHSEKAFFYKLFQYDASNTQSLAAILEHKKSYEVGIIEYVEIQTVDNIFHRLGTKTEKAELIITSPSKPFVSFKGNYGGVPTTSMRSADLSGNPAIVNVTDDSVNENYNELFNYGDQIAQFWFFNRSSVELTRVDTFLVEGVTMEFLKNFTNSSEKYQIIGMTKDWEANTTEIRALFLGSQNYSNPHA